MYLECSLFLIQFMLTILVYSVIEDTLTLQLVYTLNIVQVKGHPETWYKE